MIIARYITKEVVLTFLSITGILLLIAISNRFAMFLAKAATGELPVSLVFHLVWLYIPELLSFLIPLSLFMSILFTYGRLHADSEMTVLFACGVSWSYLSKITLILAAAIMLIVAVLSLWAVPALSLHREKALSEGEALAVIHSMLPGRFQTIGEGNLVFYLEDINSKDNSLKGVFIAEQPAQSGNNKGSWTLITSKSAQVEKEANTKDFYLVLKDGVRYQGQPGTGDYRVIKFDEYGRAVQQEVEPVSADILRVKESSALWQSGSLEDMAEFQWRLSIPISVLILALLAIPLARVSPRHGRFAKFLPAIILYIIYYNLFTLSKRWVAAGTLPSLLGVWWVHLIFLIIAMVLLAKESGWIREFRSNNTLFQAQGITLKRGTNR
jgi:lipopolysaccharide export system permease protein